jgi:hypothetical protein
MGCITPKKERNRIQNWKTDIEFLKTELPKRHYNMFFSISKEQYESGLDQLSAQLSDLNDIEIYLKLLQLIAQIEDSHTIIYDKESMERFNLKFMPFNFYWFQDGIYILNAPKSYKELLGKKIKKVNGIKINQLIDSISTLRVINNEALKKNIVFGLSSYQVFEFFNYSNDGTLLFEVESPIGEISTHEIDVSKILIDKQVQLKRDSIPFTFSWREQNIFFKDKYLQNKKTYFIQYNNCWSREKEKEHELYGNAEELPSFKEFEDKVINTIENNPIEKLIFDLRFNSGGSATQGTRLIEKISQLKEINKKGKLFVVIGRDTFSSAIINSMDFKRLTQAIFVGEQTSGSPNHYGEVKNFILPNSKLIVQYSTKYIETSEKEINTITPDIEVELSFNDYLKGIDPVYDTILNFD